MEPRRFRNVIVALALSIVAASMTFTVLPYLPIDWARIDWGDVVIVGAAVVQAISALAIVALTKSLARTATSALQTSDRQVELAETSSRMQRWDLQVSSAPIVELGVPAIASATEVIVHVKNTSTNGAALDVVVSFAPADDNWTVIANDLVRHRVGTIPPGGDKGSTIDISAFRNVPNPMYPTRPREARYSHDYIVVRESHRGIMGQRIYRDYRWSANFDDQTDPDVWSPLRVGIAPDIEGTTPATVDYDR